MLANDTIKGGVKFVHQVDHLQRLQPTRNVREANNIREKHRHALILFGLHRMAQLEAISDLSDNFDWLKGKKPINNLLGQHTVEENVGLLLLLD